MLETPRWIIELLEQDSFVCPHCNCKFRAKDIKACGIRLSYRNERKQVLYVEYHCSHCEGQPTLLELYDLDFTDFAFGILDGVEFKESPPTKGRSRGKSAKSGKGQRSKRQLPKRSKITKKEIEDIKHTLYQSPTHADFLMSLGMSPEDFDINHDKKVKNGNGSDNESEN